LRADRFPPDPVVELRQLLRTTRDELPLRYPEVAKAIEGVKPDDRDAAILNQRERLLAARVKALHTLPELRRALLLQNWQLAQPGEALSDMDRKYRDQVADRFRAEVRRIFTGVKQILQEGDVESQLALLNMLAELAPTALRAAEEASNLGRGFDREVAKLVDEGKTPVVRETAARALGQIFPNPEVAVPSLRQLLQPPHTVAERQAAAFGLQSLIRVVTLLATGSSIETRTKTEVGIKDVITTSTAVVPVACLGLEDPDPEVRRLSAEAIEQAAAALSSYAPHPRPEEDVTGGTLLPEDVARIRKDLSPLMLALKAKAGVLRQAAGDRDPLVRVAVMRALEIIGTVRQQFQQSTPAGAVNPGTGDPLLQTVTEALPAVIRELSDPAVPGRLKALDVLETMGPDAAPAIPDLVRVTRDPELFVRWSAARTLGKIGPVDTPATLPALTRLLQDVDLDVAVAAARALGYYGPEAKAAVPALIQSLKKASDGRMRLAVIASLKEIGTDSRPAIPALVAALTDPDLDVRRAAAEALGLFGPTAAEAAPALRAALQQNRADLADPVLRVREAAARVRQAISDALLTIVAAEKVKDIP
jgi:HEAT repeat protein